MNVSDLRDALGPMLSLWWTVVGLCVGSFLNVVIARVPHGQSIVRPGSRCPKCGHELRWFENIPVLSWLWLRGKCRACKTPISLRYPMIELLTGALFLACLRKFDWSWEMVSAVTLVVLLIPLTFIDLEHWILPFSLTIPGIALGLLIAYPVGGLERVRDSALGAAFGFLGFWALEWVGEKVFRKEALGGGDKFLLAMLGAFLTHQMLLGIVFFASVQGMVVGILLLVFRGRAGPAPTGEGPSTTLGVNGGETPGVNGGETPGVNGGETPGVNGGETPGVTSAEKSGDSEEDDWVPGPTTIPYGPWLSLGGLELLLFGDQIAELLPYPLGLFLGGG